MCSLGEYSVTPEEQCRHVYEALNALSISSLPQVSDLQRAAHRLMLAQGSAQMELSHVGHILWPPGSGAKIPLRVPLLLAPSELLDTSVSELLRRFGTGAIAVFRALLDGKRIIFLGHSQTAEVVCMSVLSCPLLVSPPLDGVLARCYPYTTLNSLDFLSVDGFIAGTTNPIFESHAEWWDVLCDLDSGKVRRASPSSLAFPRLLSPSLTISVYGRCCYRLRVTRGAVSVSSHRGSLISMRSSMSR